MASITKRGDSWFAQIRRKGHKSISKSFPKKSLADQWVRTIEAEMDAAKFQDTRSLASVPFSRLIDRYTLEMEAVKPFGKNKTAVLKNLNRDLGKVGASELTDTRIMEYVSKRRKDGAGGVTIGIDLTYIGSVLKAAKHLWKMPVSLDPLDTVRQNMKYLGISTRSKERDRRPTQEELDAIYAHYAKKAKYERTIPMSDIIQFAIETAMREGEITSILWSDINEADKTVMIRNRKHPQEKEGNDQTVPLLGEAFNIVMRQPKTDDRIFPYQSATIASIFPRACNALEIVDLRFHDLRHEGISRLFEQGYRMEQVMLVSGHRDPKMLFRYVQVKAKDLHR